MGLLCCKEKGESSESYAPSNSQIQLASEEYTCQMLTNLTNSSWTETISLPVSGKVDQLVKETLGVIGNLVNNEQEPPASLMILHSIAERDVGWINIVSSMARVVPMDDPLGPLVITLILDDCPLPSRDCVSKVGDLFQLSAEQALQKNNSITLQRNICVILGCLAEKLAGPNSIATLTKDTLEYLLTYLKTGKEPKITLFTLIALEKFSQTRENKCTIADRLSLEPVNPLVELEKLANSDDFIWRQVGFSAQWCLDNLFLIEGRPFSYHSADFSNTNVILDPHDMSQYLKIGPTGLEARCDSHSFESVRSTFGVDTGCWYYESLIMTPGVMQIGFATKFSDFENQEGYGIGDTNFSIAYDGCRRLKWFNANSEPQPLPSWVPGDILGCLLDIEKKEVIFSVNGVSLAPCSLIFEFSTNGFYAAASFMSYQQCSFNFGSKAFAFPPKDKIFSDFNSHASLQDHQKVIMPRHIVFDKLKNIPIPDNLCSLCCDEVCSVMLQPCGHTGFCVVCSYQLLDCPFCRAYIQSKQILCREDTE